MRKLLPLLLLAGCAAAEGQPKNPEGPVIVELFTSQGCSSCPPADQLLAKLASGSPSIASPSIASPSIAPLSFHVDYWNDLGWADPYSLPAWTQRQHAYANALGDTRVYTPELVVGGATGMVGSNTSAVMAAIEHAPRPALLPATAVWTKGSLEVTATAPAGADVFVAVWEAERTIKVTRGENSGSALSNSRVVRRLERVATAGKPGTIMVKLDPAWHGVGAVVFAQRPDKRILASAMLPSR
jgi:hypothetical protein